MGIAAVAARAAAGLGPDSIAPDEIEVQLLFFPHLEEARFCI